MPPTTTEAKTLFEKLWDSHVVRSLGENLDLLHVDRLLIHDLSGSRALTDLNERGLSVRNPELCLSMPDHSVSSLPGRTLASSPNGVRLGEALRDMSAAAGIPHYGIDHPNQGIVHIVGPETGFTLPGSLLVCGDSHTSTHGAMGALAWGIGSSELVHVLATQTIRQRRPGTMRITVDGELGDGVEAKDVILHIIGALGVAAGTGNAIEYAGTTIGAMSIEERLTICNLSIEFGARMGMVAPDDTTYAYLKGLPLAPQDEAWDRAETYWRSLPTDDDAVFDREETFRAEDIAPQITWGTSPGQTLPVNGIIPSPGSFVEAEMQYNAETALDYMGLQAGKTIAGTKVDRVFIGSCTNSRLIDLRRAAEVARGRQVAANVTAWVVPGSVQVKREAEAEGLHDIFLAAGFEWREPGCSQCVATNGEVVAPGERCVSTSNRNFVGRQGPKARTHLAGPAMAAAAAIAGEITDVRALAPTTGEG
ncbi:MAG: 3-isopropylmalate dehydratase large subunit [Alphaproteobacteria bacterium]|nr:3-isopropylmalate dehydratase large subunit [Alphaproteobacteria bacterium]